MYNTIYNHENVTPSTRNKPKSLLIGADKNPSFENGTGAQHSEDHAPRCTGDDAISPLWYPADELEGWREFNLWNDINEFLKSDKRGIEFRNTIKWYYQKTDEILLGELTDVPPRPYNYLAHQQIYFRTLRYNKFLEIIPRRHFLEGIVLDDGCSVNKGCGIKNRNYLTSIIQNLHERHINSHIPCFTIYGQKQKSKAFFAFDRTLAVLVYNLFQWYAVDAENQGFIYNYISGDGNDKFSRKIIEKLFSKEAFWCAVEDAWLDWHDELEQDLLPTLLPLSLCGLPAFVTDAEPRDSVDYGVANAFLWLDSFSVGDNGTRHFERKEGFFVKKLG